MRSVRKAYAIKLPFGETLMPEPRGISPEPVPESFHSLAETQATLCGEWRNAKTRGLWLNKARAMCRAHRVRIDLAEDALSDTVEKILEGKRRRPMTLDWDKFLYGCLRSVVDHIRVRELRQAHQPVTELIPAPDNIEQTVIYDELLAQLDAELSRDPELYEFHKLRMLGYEGVEIGRILSLTPQRQEALRKRYERFLRAWMATHLQGKPER
jgi:DNA-directed RNA polymerase specialized sigma24 family protein